MAVAGGGDVRHIRMRVQIIDAEISKEEHSLRLTWWSTTVRNDTKGTSTVKQITFERDDRRVSKPFDVTVPLGATVEEWSTEEMLWVSAMTYARSEDGPIVGGRDGVGHVTLVDLQAAMIHRKHTERIIDIPIFIQLPGTGNKPLRRMTVRILEITDEVSVDWVHAWKFQKTEQLIGSNAESQHDALLDFVDSNMYPFSASAAAHGLGIDPSRETVADIHAPLYFANVPMPAAWFWTETGEHAPSPAMGGFLASLARASLARHGWDEAEFLNVVDTQFAVPDGSSTYDRRFTMAAAVVADTANIVSTSMFYRFDNLFMKQNKLASLLRGGKAVVRDIESFQDALRYSGGDCDDTAGQIHRTFRWLKMGRPEHADRSKYWKAYGGWDGEPDGADKLLEAMQRVAFWYVSGGQLSSVTASHIEQTERSDGSVIIDSSEDLEAKVGGHLYCEFVPAHAVETMLRRTNSELGEGALRPGATDSTRGQYPVWMTNLPHLVGEGTGSVFPLVMPFETYFGDDAANREWARVHQNRMQLAAAIVANAGEGSVGNLQIQRLPPRSLDVPDARANSFYRASTSFFTDDLALWAGLRVFEMMWVYTGDRTAGAYARGKWTYGVNMRDKAQAPGGTAPTALIMMPGTDDEQAASFKARARHLCPWKQPTRTPEVMQGMRSHFEPLIDAFNSKLPTKVSASASATAAATKTTTRAVAVFRRKEFMNAKFREAVIDDINAEDRIVRARAVLEDFDDELFNVRVEFDVLTHNE